MSSIGDKISAWGENDSIIACVRVAFDRSDAACELCGNWIAAVPAAHMKAQQSGWHLICRECVNEVRRHSDAIKFLGRFATEDEAQKVLPK